PPVLAQRPLHDLVRPGAPGGPARLLRGPARLAESVVGGRDRLRGRRGRRPQRRLGLDLAGRGNRPDRVCRRTRLGLASRPCASKRMVVDRGHGCRSGRVRRLDPRLGAPRERAHAAPVCPQHVRRRRCHTHQFQAVVAVPDGVGQRRLLRWNARLRLGPAIALRRAHLGGLGLRGALRLARPRLLRAAELAWRPGQRRARGSGRGPLEHEAQTSAIAWCAFWGSSAILLSASFIFSSNPIDINSSRYLVGVIYAVAALLPLLASRAMVARVAVTTGVTVFALSGLVSLLENEELATGSASYSLIHQVERYLDS